MTLDPLDNDAIDALLRGLVPGIDEDAVGRIRERAEGIPFYAVETVRMLLDWAARPGEAGYRVTGDLSSLQVPETLQTLIAARLDALEADESAPPGRERPRADVQRSRPGSARRWRRDVAAADARRPRPQGSLYLDNDPFSPERGQYGFLQALVQRVAYETLSRRDRKAKHLAAAAYLASSAGIDPDEIAEVVAAHYLDAFRADEDAHDAADIRSSARGWLERAAERATSPCCSRGSTARVRSGSRARRRPVGARTFDRARGEHGAHGEPHDRRRGSSRVRAICSAGGGDLHGSARTAAGIARALVSYGRTEDAIRLAEEAYEVLGADELDRDGAALAAERHACTSSSATSTPRWLGSRSAIPVAERTKDMALLVTTLNTKAMVYSTDRPHEAYALVQAALRIALDHDLVYEALRSYNNTLVQLEQLDRSEEMLPMLEEALALARRRGDRQWLDQLTAAAITESILRVAGTRPRRSPRNTSLLRRTSRPCRRTPISPKSHGGVATRT